MNKVADILRGTRNFIGEVRNELRKSSWPTRNELLESTVVVILSVILFSIFIGISDTVLVNIVRFLMR